MTRFLSEERNMALLDRLEVIGREYGKSVAEVALAWLRSRPGVTSPIIGANNVAQLKELLGAADLSLSPEEIKELDELTSWQ